MWIRTSRLRVRPLLIVISILSLALFARPVSAGYWKGTGGPEGGPVTALVIDPIHPATLYAGTSFEGLFRSEDGASSWRLLNTGTEDPVKITALAIVLGATSTLYVAKSSAGLTHIAKSTDGGAIWVDVSQLPNGASVSAIVPDPAQPLIMYAVSPGNGVYKTINGGAVWGPMNAGPLPASVNGLAVDPANPLILYASTNASGVYTSVNAAQTWSPMNNGLTGTSLNATAVAVDPFNPGTVYVATNAGLFESANGAPWQQVLSGKVVAMAFDPSTSGVIYAGNSLSGNVISKTINGGAQWSGLLVNFALPATVFTAIAVDPTSPSTVYAASEAGVFRTDNGGTYWRLMNTGLTASFVTTIAVDPTNALTMYASALGGGVYKTYDGGGSWVLAISGLSDDRVQSMVIDPANPTTVYAATNTGVRKSVDAGMTWTGTTLGVMVTALGIDPVNTATLYAGTSSQGIYKSTDGGSTWNSAGASTPSYANAIAVDPAHPATLYVGTYTDVWMSTDSGDQWTPIYQPKVPVLALALAPTKPTTLYAAIYGSGVWRTADGGATSQLSSNGLANLYVHSLAVDPIDPTIVYAGTLNAVFKGVNSGTSWTPMGGGLTRSSVNALAVAHTNPPTFYAGTAGAGVFIYTSTPGAATLIAPSGTASTKPVFSWNAVPDATQYALYVEAADRTLVVNGSVYTASQAGCSNPPAICSPSAITLPSGTYTWWIQTENSAGEGEMSSPLTFTVSGPPAAAVLTSPKGVANSTTPTYTWKAVPDATWYYLWVGNKIATWYTAAQAGCSSGTCSITPATALTAGTYTWWIQTWNTAGNGPWSSGATFAVAPPPVAALLSPKGPVASKTPTYRWAAVPSASWYYLRVDDSTGTKIKTWYTPAQANCANSTLCSVTPTTAVAVGTSRWWIMTSNSAGDGPWSPAATFSLTVPPVATLVSPFGAAKAAGLKFYWSAVPTSTWYCLWIDDSTQAGKVKVWYTAADAHCSVSGPCWVTAPTGLAMGAGKWWIQTWNDAGAGPWSSEMDFTLSP
jgi:hypothetical protein